MEAKAGGEGPARQAGRGGATPPGRAGAHRRARPQAPGADRVLEDARRGDAKAPRHRRRPVSGGRSDMPDPYRLERFVAAQDDGGAYQAALRELRDGRKRSHWMWFVFPQIAGLGQSATSRRYAISSLEEARAYVAHPVL